MNAIKNTAVVLIAVGVVGVVYGCFNTRANHVVKVGPVEFSVKEERRDSTPIWLGGGAIAIGGGMWFVGNKNNGGPS